MCLDSETREEGPALTIERRVSMKCAVRLSCVVFLVALSASAQPFRTFVSGNGSDSNPSCAVTAPCRTFAQALSVVAPGGEVIALDTAGFGANVTISHAVS